jgi:regulator of protease activity HflC (stomatin/prohibitin superfamily)
LRVQTRDQTYQVVSEDGLHFTIELTVRWRVIRHNIIRMNQVYGPDYVNKLLIPEIGSETRKVIARYKMDALISKRRATVQSEIYEAVTADALPNGISHTDAISPELTDAIVSQDSQGHNVKDVIVLLDVLVKKVELPTTVRNAIENKLVQNQVAKEYEFRVEREKLETERKQIEAKGIRRFQETVTKGITESYLRWRGIEATLKLAQSPNSKVVVIGNSATGLPLILDTKSSSNPLMPMNIDVSEAESQGSLTDQPRSDQGSLEMMGADYSADKGGG